MSLILKWKKIQPRFTINYTLVFTFPLLKHYFLLKMSTKTRTWKDKLRQQHILIYLHLLYNSTNKVSRRSQYLIRTNLRFQFQRSMKSNFPVRALWWLMTYQWLKTILVTRPKEILLKHSALKILQDFIYKKHLRIYLITSNK